MRIDLFVIDLEWPYPDDGDDYFDWARLINSIIIVSLEQGTNSSRMS